MKPLKIKGETLLFVNNNAFANYGKNTLITCSPDEQRWLTPEELVLVRDWINERCRELAFQGHLPESHPTA
jgi:hypothetical protein